MLPKSEQQQRIDLREACKTVGTNRDPKIIKSGVLSTRCDPQPTKQNMRNKLICINDVLFGIIVNGEKNSIKKKMFKKGG